MAHNLILTGFSGAGKSEVGRLIAHAAGRDFIDTDEEIVRAAGKPVADIFAQDGETHFRHLERQAVARACADSNVVISTGGGAIVDPDNYRTMAASGVIVCLDATPETILSRLESAARGGDPEAIRPLLAGPEPLNRITELKARRQRYYDQAHRTIHTDGLTTEQVAQRALDAFNTASQDRPSATQFDPSFIISTESAT